MGSRSWSWILWYFCTAEMSSVSIHQEFLGVCLCGLATYLHVTSIILYCWWCLCYFWQPWGPGEINNLSVALCILYIFPLFSAAGLLEKGVYKGQLLHPLVSVNTGGDRQGCRQAELHSLMGEEHGVAHRQSNGQPGGEPICLPPHHIPLHHSVHTRPLTILTNTAEPWWLGTTG